MEIDTGNGYDKIYIDINGNVLFNARGLPKVYGVGYASTYFFGFGSNFTNGKAVAARRVNESTDARMDIEDAPVIIDKSGNILATISKEYYADESGFDPNMMVKIKPGGRSTGRISTACATKTETWLCPVNILIFSTVKTAGM